ncbi:MAG TPA: glutamate-cysteine ligase family protein [Actinomycetota bacterium]|nr:glutamate-cysteine ligase family protein [Actinomycetota bacterium]
MGLAIERERFDQADVVGFERRLEESLVALGRLLRRPGFGIGPPTVGAELELFLVDSGGRALPINQAVRAEAADPRVVLEVDRFNLELNLTPAPLAGRPFAAFAAELDQALGVVRRAAAWHGGRIVMAGILPTLRAEELHLAAISDAARYRALNAGIRRLRQEPFLIGIDGVDPLELATDDIALEGANTSFQVHLKVDPDRFAACCNAAQLAIGPVLAVAGNSPTFLGHRLWEETRVALFKQALDDRDAAGRSGRRVGRVAFGGGWTAGALELLEESVRLHEPVLPVLGSERPLELVAAGRVPTLEELRLHQGTVWRWNRAIYDPAGGGHLRIEMRALPSGPTVVDMLANAAFLLGLTLAMAPEADTFVRRMAFQQVHDNFYRAASVGLDAELAWPLGPGGRVRTLPAAELVPLLLPVARSGLEGAGVLPEEVDELLAVVEARAAGGQTGAVWQRRTLAALTPRLGWERALAAMLERYLDHQLDGQPVHTWPVPAGVSGGGRPAGAMGRPARPGPGRPPPPPPRPAP